MVQAICNGWISASGVSIYLLDHAVRDQRVGAGRADHNHDLGGGSIEDLGLAHGTPPSPFHRLLAFAQRPNGRGGPRRARAKSLEAPVAPVRAYDLAQGASQV